MVREWLLTYGVPFVGSVLLAIGIVGGVMGGYALVQPAIGFCGDPQITVYSAEDTERLREGHTPAGGPELDRLRIAELSPAERRAVRAGIEAPGESISVEGATPHRAAFRRGVLVVADGQAHYVTLATENDCTQVSPLLLPLGIAAGLLGIVGVLTPPIYRRYLAFERSQHGDGESEGG
ncbi:hypothetical protein BV210_05990 [Halorientalis sp. IM1011]|uniref:hypothetical protein n=1 Tax=Halorientalis sp. IM1011 TaxID=1932360 RepID=UPI00097CD277|nr:hypothetical protein [Halorientalis sp. IM1011]AQL42291.1 hypothetical protein BV210_05990 [Halorientalis sp. IM1011]